MKHTGTCPKCASTDILGNVLALDSNDWCELCVGRDRYPQALILKERVTTPVFAWVCASCGYTELYAERPEAIRDGEGTASPVPCKPYKNPFS